MASRPVPAARKTTIDRGSSTGLLISVIRSLTSSVSEDQRVLERARLSEGFKRSEQLIDNLVKDHQNDVEECLDSFRDVSTKVSACRERIHNVRNALQTCKSLLECRRDDLKKLWLENAQQKYICEILTRLEELKDAPLRVDVAIAAGQYQEAARIISTSRELLDGRLSSIEGLKQLRINLVKSAQQLSECIIGQVVEMLVVDPFELHMFDIVANMTPQRVQESEQCQKLSDKFKNKLPETESLSSSLALALAALAELENGSMEIDKVLSLSAIQLSKMVSSSVILIKTRASSDSSDIHLDGDQSHLKQLLKLVMDQLESSRDAHKVLADIVASTGGSGKIMSSFWDASQAVVETLVSDHLDITPLTSKDPLDTKKQLFRFDATAYAGSASVNSSSTPNALVVCQPSSYNMLPMFPFLRSFMEGVENTTGEKPCKLRRFVHSFVMELFVERVKAGLADKLESALKSPDGTRNARMNNAKILPSCEKVLELCKEVHALVVSMDLYADRFAAIWLLLLSEYNANVVEMYEKTTLSLGEAESRRKISAAWAADEDISRLLMSLPNWEMAAAADDQTPNSPVVESEMEIRQRNERESDILIGNLGTQKRMERAEILTDMGDVRALAALHESLRWFGVEVRKLVSSLPKNVMTSLRGCYVQVRLKDGQVLENEPVLKSMEDLVKRLESISDTCLLMLHLELRVHCFFHLLPIARPRMSNVHDEIDQEVVELGRDLQTFHQLLSAILSQPKLRYIFDGLGHLCAAIFIHTSQNMPRLSESGKKRICRDVWGVQQRLSQITSRREAALDRARHFFENLSHEPDRLLTLIPELRGQFSPMELGYLIALSIRSHPSLANQPGALEQRMNQLSAILRQPQE